LRIARPGGSPGASRSVASHYRTHCGRGSTPPRSLDRQPLQSGFQCGAPADRDRKQTRN
jgi:hypothetical protein